MFVYLGASEAVSALSTAGELLRTYRDLVKLGWPGRVPRGFDRSFDALGADLVGHRPEDEREHSVTLLLTTSTPVEVAHLALGGDRGEAFRGEVDLKEPAVLELAGGRDDVQVGTERLDGAAETRASASGRRSREGRAPRTASRPRVARAWSGCSLPSPRRQRTPRPVRKT